MMTNALTIFKKYLKVLKRAGVSDGSELVEIDENSLWLEKKIDFWPKMAKSSQSEKFFDNSLGFENFVKELEGHLIRLNHLGVRYACVDIQKELLLLKKDFPVVYEENSHDLKSRWFFVGKPEDWQKPLFEMVLSTYPDGRWQPHLQIDIDTDLDYDHLRRLMDKTLGKDFVEWELTLPNYGTVLTMGMLADYGVKIFLGIGTKLRKTEFHRNTLLKPA